MVHLVPLYAILLVSVAAWFFSKRGAWAVLAVIVLTGFIAVQAGGSLYVILTNPYGRQYQTVTNYVLEHERPGDRIVGTSELGFGIGFDNLYDDIALGYYVGKKPGIIIMSPRYQAWYSAIRGRDPAWDYVQKVLSEYTAVFQTDAFQVYLPVSSDANRQIDRAGEKRP